MVALDARRSWFRHHRLFADLLELELRHTEPAELATTLHGTAADHLVRGFLEIARGRVEAALAALRTAGRLPGRPFSAAHPITSEVRAFLLHVLVRRGETVQADAALTETADEERERPGMRTAVAALRLAQDNPRAATAALAPVLDSSVPGSHQVWLTAAFLLEASARQTLGEREAASFTCR